VSSPSLECVDEHGATIEPCALAFASRPCSDEEFAAIATAARRTGRVLERDGLALFAVGTAITFVAKAGFATEGAAAASLEALQAIDSPGDTTTAGHGPVLLGALPFDSTAPAELTVPSVVALENDHLRLLVAVAPGAELDQLLSDPLASLDAARESTTPPDHFELTSVQSHESFKALVAEAVAAIERGAFEKVVLAREVAVVGNRPFAPSDLLARLRALYPSCVTFSLDHFVGASPELLCRRRDSVVTSHPLAGTVARSGDPDEDERLARGLLASPKERGEHGIVVNAIVADLSGLAAEVTASPEPHLLELRNVVHLATTITGHLREPLPGALEIAVALHPTPAIGGWPRAAAIEWIADHEGLERDRYAGPLGYMDATGDGEWWLGIRSALLDGKRARLLAGVGIVADSDPAAELAETQLKLQALLAAAVRP
jgi:menaquinone-specific isochorismate synthase